MPDGPPPTSSPIAGFLAARARFLAAFDAFLTDPRMDRLVRDHEVDATVSALRQLAELRGGG